MYGALKVLGAKDRSEIRNQKFVMCGAGSAGMGIVSMLHKAVMKSGGLSEEEAYDNFFIMDNNGLITNERELSFQGSRGGTVRESKESDERVARWCFL